MADLTVVKAERAGGPLGANAKGATTRQTGDVAFKTPRVYADFLVDGHSLAVVVRRNTDMISVLGWGPERWQREVLDQLLLRANGDLPSGRHSLFVCPECGDLSCGVLGATIERVGGRVTWRDFAYENGRDSPSTDGWNGLGPYTFDWVQYEAAIRSGLGLGGYE